MNIFTDTELAYLGSQRLGRLANVDAGGAPKNNPVGFRYNPDLVTVDIFGLNMGATRKYRNVLSHPEVALVVDDIASVDPWVVRGVEIRGRAEALDAQSPPRAGMSRQIIRVHPRRIISWGVDPDHPGINARDLQIADSGQVA